MSGSAAAVSVPTDLPIGAVAALFATAIVTAGLPVAIRNALAGVRVWVADGISRTVVRRTAVPVAAFTLTIGRACWAAKLFSIAVAEATRVIATFGDPIGATLRTARCCSVWALACHTIPRLFARARDRFRSRCGPSSRLRLIQRRCNRNAAQPKQAPEYLPSISGNCQFPHQRIETSIFHDLPF